MQTFTGRQFWPLDARVDELEIRDIAHALSMMCRYAGHCNRFYSVAEHSCLISYWLPDEFKLWGLLHDATEAYLVDIPRPIKRYINGYLDMEFQLQKVVSEKFGLDGDVMPPLVKEADNRILLDEMVQNMGTPPAPWGLEELNPLGVELRFWTPEVAELMFLSQFEKLTKGK